MDSGPSPYSGIEHESFLSALSKKDSTWFRESGLRGAIHSFRYFLLLQAQLPRHLLESSDIGSTNKNNWTFEDELAFERGLSEIEENDPKFYSIVSALYSVGIPLEKNLKKTRESGRPGPINPTSQPDQEGQHQPAGSEWIQDRLHTPASNMNHF